MVLESGAPMSEFYVIRWKSKVNGKQGKGNKQFTQEEAQHMANQLNRQYPHIEHEVEPAPKEADE